MTRKTRFIILLSCAVLFLIVVPYLVLYSLGYRVDFTKFQITATGGIYVKAVPEGANITIDSNPGETTGFLSPSVFAQNLLPGVHAIAIQKDGYYNYQKNLAVVPKQVTKLEHVFLIKQHISFSLLDDSIDSFYTAPDSNKVLLTKSNEQKTTFEILDLITNKKETLSASLQDGPISDAKWSGNSSKVLLQTQNNYFLLEPFLAKPQITQPLFLSGAQEASFNPNDSSQIFFIKNSFAPLGATLGNSSGQVQNLYVNNQPLPLVKNVVAYQIKNNTITYLAYDGFLYNYNLQDKIASKITSQIFPIKKNSAYTITTISGKTFLQEENSLFLLNPTQKIFENFYGLVTTIKASPDGQKILYYNDHATALSLLNSQSIKPIFLNTFTHTITDAYWLNNDYIIVNTGGDISISEIDIRGNVNIVNLPNTALLPDNTSIDIKNPEIFFNQQDKKLYILTQNNLISSEPLP